MSLRGFVGIKRVIDYAVRTRVRSDKQWVETEGVKHSMNPFDEIAIEAALRLKEAKVLSHITAVSCGPQKCQDVLRTALALGVDQAIHIELNLVDGSLQPIAVAKLLAALVKKEKPDVIFMGKQAIDDDFNQTGQYLAGLLNYPQATFASEIDASDPKRWMITREVDGGLQKIAVKLPFVLTTDLRLNEPRYATLQNIMKSKKIPIHKETPESLGIPMKDLEPKLKIESVEEPPKRTAGIMVSSVDELVQKLKDAQVL